MTIKKIFKSRIPSIRFIFKNGVNASFQDGRYITDVDYEISELMAEIVDVGADKSKHAHLYVDSNETEFDTEAPTAIELIKQKAREEARAELLAEQAAANKDLGSTDSKPVLQGIGTTKTIAALDPNTPNDKTVNVNHDAAQVTEGVTQVEAAPAATNAKMPVITPVIKPAGTATITAAPAAK